MFTDLITTDSMRTLSNTFGDLDLFDSFDELMNSTRLSFQESFPPMNVFYYADSESAEITLALAGYSKDELSVEANGNTIIVEATPKAPITDKEEKGTYLKRRIHKKEFRRTYALPSTPYGTSYDTSKAEVEFKDGLLKICVPALVKEEPSGKKLTIN